MSHFHLHNRWIMRDNGTSIPSIVGRVFGPDGAVAYQLAGRPHDALPVFGFADEQSALNAATSALNAKEACT